LVLVWISLPFFRVPLTPAAPVYTINEQSKPWSFAAYCSHVKQMLKRETPGGLAGPFLFLPLSRPDADST